MINKQTITLFLGILLVVSMLNLIPAVSITDVSSMPEEVAPGETIDISIEIENIFEDEVYNLNVKLNFEEIPFAPYQSSSEEFLEELDSEEDETFTFKLIVLPETSSGIYKIPVEITYEDEEGNFSTKTELISLTVNSEPELKVSFEDTALIKGRENTLSIKIVNSGLADVKFVYIGVRDVIGIRFLSEKEQYIGDVDSDDFDSVKYDVYINAEASNSITLPVTLSFRDATNKEFTENKNLVLRTYSLKEAQELGFVKKPGYTNYIVVGVLVLIYLGYRMRKRRKKKLKAMGR